jgi:hypothetical protein
MPYSFSTCLSEAAIIEWSADAFCHRMAGVFPGISYEDFDDFTLFSTRGTLDDLMLCRSPCGLMWDIVTLPDTLLAIRVAALYQLAVMDPREFLQAVAAVL